MPLYGPPALPLTGGTLTGPILAAAGSVAAPSYSFSVQPGTGLLRDATWGLMAAVSGARLWASDASDGSKLAVRGLRFSADLNGTATDVRLERDAANTLALRNGVNAQEMRWYSSYTDVSNYSRLVLKKNAAGWIILPENAGSGSNGNLQLAVPTGSSLNFCIGLQPYITMLSTGALQWVFDNAYSLGDPTHRPSTIYAGTSIVSPLATLLPTDAVTNARTVALTVGHASSGTPAADFGSEIRMQASSDTTASQDIAALSASWATATHASRKGRFRLWAYDTAVREVIRGEASGSAPMLGFFGAAAVVQQVGASAAGIAAVIDPNVKAALVALQAIVANLGLATAPA